MDSWKYMHILIFNSLLLILVNIVISQAKTFQTIGTLRYRVNEDFEADKHRPSKETDLAIHLVINLFFLVLILL